jgi:EpsI family protein
VPTYLEDTFIQFPNGVLEVAVQCSGAGYLISILAIGLPLAFLVLRTRRSRVMLLTAAVVISILANWARITLIGTVGYMTGWGPQVHGPLHILQGMLVYWIGFGALFAGGWILARMERRKVKPATRPAPASAAGIAPPWTIWRRHWRIALATLVIAIVYLSIYDRGPVAAKQRFASLPQVIGQWTAVESRQDSAIVRIPGADQEVLRVYRKADGSTAALYVAYLSSQTQSKELVNYVTAPLHRETVAATITIGVESQPVNIGFSEDRRSRRPILFWYALNGRAFAGRYAAKAATIAQALLHEGSNGAFVLISGESKWDGQEIVVDDLEQFAQDLVPLLRPYLP